MIDNTSSIQQLAEEIANNYPKGIPIKIPSMKFSDWSKLLRLTIEIEKVKKLKG